MFATSCFITVFVLVFAIRNIVWMHKLGISRTLITLLYIAIVSREVIALSEIFILAKFHYIDYAATDGTSLYFLGTAMRFFSTSLDVTIVLTNY